MKTTHTDTEIEVAIPGALPCWGGGISVIDPWALIAILPCPACGSGRLVWAEAGNVPGWRVCDGCGREFIAAPRGDVVRIAIPQVDRGAGPELAWQPPEPGEAPRRWAREGSGVDPERAVRCRARRHAHEDR